MSVTKTTREIASALDDVKTGLATGGSEVQELRDAAPALGDLLDPHPAYIRLALIDLQ